jgi:YVTN family beta-propeller protein
LTTIPLSRSGFPYKGANPNSLALSPDERTLYVTLGGENAVAVVNLDTNSVAGRIPVGWYPSSVNVSSDGRRLFVVNSKSVPGPNATLYGQVPNPTYRNDYIFALEKASLSLIAVPDAPTLALMSSQVDLNNGFLDNHYDPLMVELREKIKHVIYIVKENRSYDQVLGDLPGGNRDPGLTMFPYAVSPNHHELAKQFVNLDNFYVTGEGSGEGWNWSSQSTINEFTAKTIPPGYGNGFSSLDVWATSRNIVIAMPERGFPATPFNSRLTGLLDPNGKSAILPTAKDIAAGEGDGDLSAGAVGGYLWDEVLRSGKTLRHYGFYTDYTYYSVPPPLFIRITRTPFADNIPQGPPMKQSLMQNSDIYYRGFDLSVPDRYHYEEWKREFDQYVANNNLPALQVLSLPLDHFGSFESNVGGLNTPQLQMADNDYALGKIVEAVSTSKYWKDTAIFVIEDDAQDGPDHVDAHRSPAYVISAYTRRGEVVSEYYTTVNMMRTMEDLLGIKPLTLFDANADPMSRVFTATADLTSYKAVLPGSLCKPPVKADLIPECVVPSLPRTAAVKQLRNGSWWTQVTKQFDFRRPDALNSAEFNLVLWRGIKGNKPYPEFRKRHADPDGER